MPDNLREWLDGIGLGQYAEIFVANDIDLALLPALSDDDLRELGLSLGHRRKLQLTLTESPGRLTPPGPTPIAVQPADNAAIVREAERRLLTVLFCDLVGSTQLSRQHDPEDLRELLRRYTDATTAAIVQHRGYVANYLGDGILAYFGWPQAEEDEAAQAVRAGLEAVAAVGKLGLEARVGIASGTVVVGDLDGAGGRQAGAVSGETPNLAARLQTLANPGQVVIGALTRQLVGRGFVLDDLGPQQVKGIAEPIRVWQVLAERSVESRFDARSGHLTRFIGREHELALLLDRFERAAGGEGQAVLLSGEAGIGKSRLLRELDDRLAERPHIRLRFQCSLFNTERALYPVIGHLEYAAGFQPNDDAEARLDKLERLLREAVANVAESAALLAPLLSLPVAGRYGSSELSAEQRSEGIFRVLIDQLLGLAVKHPVLYILEDAQWLDPATRELVNRTLGRIAEARVLLLITHRPDFQTDWIRHPQATALTLSRLSRTQGSEIVHAAGGSILPDGVVARLLGRADGVPLFIEELTRSVIESGASASDGDIPETLQASLLARLDRLGLETKEVAQIAAVIGREFDRGLLGIICDKPKDEVDRALQRLLAAEIVLPIGPGRESAYGFRHGLIHDAAYQSLLLSRRRHNHAQIAQALERTFPETAETQPDRIAQHYTSAELPEQAIPYWLRAGERALARFAFREPTAHLQRGLQLARALPESEARSRHILELLLALGAAQLRIGPYREALATFTEAAALARRTGSTAGLVRAALGLEEAESLLGTERGSVPVLEAALAALGEGESAERCRVLSRLGRALFEIGLTERSTGLLREAIDAARRIGDREALIEALFGEHNATSGHPWSAEEFAQRRSRLDEMLAVAEETGDPGLIGRAEYRRLSAFLEMGDLSGFETSLARNRELAERLLTGDLWAATTAGAMAALLHGEFAEAEIIAERAFELGRESQGDMASGVYGVQMFTIRREQDRLAEVAPLFRRFVDENPEDATWRPGLALIASDLGFAEAARKAFEHLAEGGFSFPIDAKWSVTMSYLTEVCVRLGDTRRGERLYELLQPYRDVTVIAPVSTVCYGAAARYLGMLAGLLGEWRTSEEHFEAALAMNERLRAWPWLAHTQYEYAAMLRRRGGRHNDARSRALLAAADDAADRLQVPALRRQIRDLEG